MSTLLDAIALIVLVGGVTLLLCGTMGFLLFVGGLILEARRLR